MNTEGFGGVCNRPVHPFAGTHVQEKADGAEQTQDGDNQTQDPMGIMEVDDGLPLWTCRWLCRLRMGWPLVKMS